MRLDLDSDRPIYLQIAGEIEDAVFSGAYPEEAQVPSTTDMSRQLRVNPATVLKGMGLLVEEGVLYKKRGLGMYVRAGAVEAIRNKRRAGFVRDFVRPLKAEAQKLGLTPDEVVALMRKDETDAQD